MMRAFPAKESKTIRAGHVLRNSRTLAGNVAGFFYGVNMIIKLFKIVVVMCLIFIGVIAFIRADSGLNSALEKKTRLTNERFESRLDSIDSLINGYGGK